MPPRVHESIRKAESALQMTKHFKDSAALTALRCGVIAYLAVLLGAGPAIRAVHFESAHHGHRYCPEHQRVEAVELDESTAPDVRIRAAEGPEAESGDDWAPRSHEVCSFLTGLAARGPAISEKPFHCSPSIGGSALSTLERPQAPPRAIEIIRLAPKTSPPVSV